MSPHTTPIDDMVDGAEMGGWCYHGWFHFIDVGQER